MLQFFKLAKNLKVSDFQAIFQFFKWAKDLHVSHFQTIFQFFKWAKDQQISNFQAISIKTKLKFVKFLHHVTQSKGPVQCAISI